MAVPLTKCKLVFLGDAHVGKTSIISRSMFGTFDQHYQATIGIDFLCKTIHAGNRTLRLQLWDTAGQERFRSLIPSYIRDSSAAILVYDVCCRSSFVGLERWLEYVRAERGDDVVVVVVGNKADAEHDRQISTKEGKEWASDHGSRFIETSAKSGENVNELFQMVSNALPDPAPRDSLAADIPRFTLPAPKDEGAAPPQFCSC
eukprot:TRINITY_DN17790_c0_g3_i1.p1 TRINITY_DN17790_c0_g3~~TRINITY_DN17790_c0_g3_i1.p1  ORF type:complete len:203 (+),score=7.99 TRINITY_DN17790_c0_g3_i1:80-688(+)